MLNKFPLIIVDESHWRTWGLYMEKDSIEIIAASHIDDVPPDDIDMNYFYQEDSFSLTEKFYRPITDINYFDAFVKDVKEYESYITENLKELQIDISVDEPSDKVFV